MTAPHPTYEQLAELPAYAEQPVPIAFEDANGHLNVRHYTGIASEGLDESLVPQGILQNWPATGHACFSAEHHLTYLAEMRTGDRMSARVRLLGRSERAAHALVYLLDETHQRLSFVMEEIFLHIDMATRRTAPWPDDVAAALDERIARRRRAAVGAGRVRLDEPALGPQLVQARHRAAYSPSSRSTSSRWLPSSAIRPSMTTAIRSASWAVWSRWAIATTVRPLEQRVHRALERSARCAGRSARSPRRAPACAGRR